MTTWTLKQAIEFAVASARDGVDQNMVEEYGFNVGTTLTENGAAQFNWDAMRAYEAEVARLLARRT